MKDLKALNDSHLLEQLISLVREERRITLEILWHLREVESRRLHAERGYPSLFEYCVKALGYSESAAFRRISTMRALKETPELEGAIKSGRLTVTTVARVQTFLRAEKIQNQKLYDRAERHDLFVSLEGKSSKEVERTLLKLSPAAARPRDQEKVISEELTEIRFTADPALMEKLKKLRDLHSHQLKDPHSYAELFSLLSDQALKTKDPLQKKSRPEKTVAPGEVKTLLKTTDASNVQKTPEVKSAMHSRYIPQKLRREAWLSSKGSCTYADPQTGKRCDSTFRLQVDHKTPFALGGSSRDPENLTLLCATHNQLRAARTFGERMKT